MHIKKKWLAGCTISLFYFCSYMGGEGLKFLAGVAPLTKHVVNFALLLSVGVVGLYGLSTLRQKWLKNVWIFGYLIIISLLLILGIIDLLIKLDNLSFRSMFGYFRLFFTSPVPYGVMLFLSDYINKENHEFIGKEPREGLTGDRRTITDHGRQTTGG